MKHEEDKEEKDSRPSYDIKDKIEQAILKFDNLTYDKGVAKSIAQEAALTSLFGVFAQNVKKCRDAGQGKDMEYIIRNAFKGSHILNDINRVLLYYNLPYKNYSSKLLPKKIFPYESQTFNALLETYEQKGFEGSKIANIIIMRE